MNIKYEYAERRCSHIEIQNQFNSKLITEIKDKLQVFANRGRITWLTWNLLGTLY